MLEIKNLHIPTGDKKILKEVDLVTNIGEIHAIMGPNGTGESTLSTAVMGDPNYEVTEGETLFDGVNVLNSEVDERACLSLSLAMQCPSETLGITSAEFMRAIINAKRDEDDKMSVMQFLEKLDSKVKLLNIPEGTAERYLDKGLSGGEEKRNEILQLLMLGPTFAILDEIDSGLDIGALKIVSEGVNEMRDENFGASIIIHYQRLLNYVISGVARIMMEGRVVKTGGVDLAKRLETEGYAGISQGLGIDYKEEAQRGRNE